MDVAQTVAQAARNKLALAVRLGTPAEIRAARRELAEANDQVARERAENRIADAIREEIEKAPPLSQEQRDRLSLLLAPARPKRSAS